MKKSKVYTKSGDKGLTSLVSGTRVSKGSVRLDLYGDVDELNSHLGLAISFLEKETMEQHTIDFLQKIQSKLFDLGSTLACENEMAKKFNLPQITETTISLIENEIDQLDSALEPLKNFILPGGTFAGSQLHVVRTVCRRVERQLVAFATQNPDEVPTLSLEFLNRLSDYFFVLARHVNFKMEKIEKSWEKSLM